MATTPAHLLTLIDSYAAARAERDSLSHAAATWAFIAAHRDMLTARNAVTDALGVTAPPLTDETTLLAEWADR